MRKNKIVEYVNTNQEANVEELSKFFHVSVETIRRDLKALDEKNLLIRIHGGAISNDANDVGTSFSLRAESNVEDKQQLVEMAVKLISEHSVIGLDASSSSWLLAKSMPNIECTVVTNSINIINALEKKKKIKIMSLGGNYSEKYKAFYGPIARNTLNEMTLDICFISCVGIDLGSGIWDSNEYNYDIKQSFIDVSSKVVLIADKSKLHKRSLLKICKIDALDCLITNTELTKDDCKYLDEKHVVLSSLNILQMNGTNTVKQ